MEGFFVKEINVRVAKDGYIVSYAEQALGDNMWLQVEQVVTSPRKVTKLINELLAKYADQ